MTGLSLLAVGPPGTSGAPGFQGIAGMKGDKGDRGRLTFFEKTNLQKQRHRFIQVLMVSVVLVMV